MNSSAVRSGRVTEDEPIIAFGAQFRDFAKERIWLWRLRSRYGELKFSPDSAANHDAVAEDLGSRGLSSQ